MGYSVLYQRINDIVKIAKRPIKPLRLPSFRRGFESLGAAEGVPLCTMVPRQMCIHNYASTCFGKTSETNSIIVRRIFSLQAADRGASVRLVSASSPQLL